MEIEVLNAKKNELEFVMKGERHTFPNLLRETLLQDTSVEFAAYKLEHPFDNDCKFVVKTKGKNAKAAVQSALKRIEKELADFEKAFKSAK